MARRTLTDKGVAALKPAAKVRNFADPQMAGHYVRVWPTGAKSFAAVARDPNGKQVWATIGNTSQIGIDGAREKARAAIAAIKAGEDRSGGESFAAVAEQWIRRHVEAKGLRSGVETRRYLDKWILPAWAGREFRSIRRGDVAKLLDHVEDNAGPVAADNALKRISAIATWYQSRHDDYASPVVKGMRRSNTKGRARDRILNDDEIRALWAATESGSFGAFVRLLLLTGQRREKVASLKWADVSIDGVWTIAAEDREKGHGGELELPAPALEILKRLDRFADNPHVFAGRGGSHFSGYSKSKAGLDAKLELEPWTLHDLRRTARSLMSRAGVAPHVAELTIGHVQNGIVATYDRHSYRDEKGDALRKLAALIETILAPAVDNVTRLDRARGKRA